MDEATEMTDRPEHDVGAGNLEERGPSRAPSLGPGVPAALTLGSHDAPHSAEAIVFALGLLGQYDERHAAAFLVREDWADAKLTPQELEAGRAILRAHAFDSDHVRACPLCLEACRRIGRMVDLVDDLTGGYGLAEAEAIARRAASAGAGSDRGARGNAAPRAPPPRQLKRLRAIELLRGGMGVKEVAAIAEITVRYAQMLLDELNGKKRDRRRKRIDGS